MSDPTFGISIATVDNEPRPALTANMSVVGLVGTAPDADELDFPLDVAVTFFSDDTAKLAKLGRAGTLYQSIAAINEQLGEFQVAAQIVVVRVAVGASVIATIANLRGDINAKTGMYALLDAPTVLAVTPRLVAVPGFTSQPVRQINPVPVSLVGGTGYTAAPTISFSGGGSDPGKVLPTAHATVSGGIVTGLIFDTLGENLTVAPSVIFTPVSGGTGASATLGLDSSSNAIVAGLPTLLDRLLAVAVVDGPASTPAAALAWRATISSKRIIAVDPAAKILDETGSIVVVPLSPYILGVAVRRDHEFNGRPFHSWANQAIAGIVGPSRPIGFSITDGATEGQSLLAQNIGVLVRGERTDGALADGGYVFVGTDTCSPDTLWTFYNQVRGRDYIHLLFIRTLRFYLGRFNITGHAIQSIVNTMTLALNDLQADQDILGFKVGFTRSQNSPEQLRLGKFTVSFAAEEPPVLRYLGIQSSRYRPALDTLLTDLLAQLDLAA